MISEYKQKTNYYIELSKDKLQQVLDDNLVQYMGYPEKESGEPYTFEEACFQLKYLDNGNIACNIQLRNAKYLKNSCVSDYISEQDFNLAKQMYGVDEFLTQEEFQELKPLEDEEL